MNESSLPALEKGGPSSAVSPPPRRPSVIPAITAWSNEQPVKTALIAQPRLGLAFQATISSTGPSSAAVPRCWSPRATRSPTHMLWHHVVSLSALPPRHARRPCPGPEPEIRSMSPRFMRYLRIGVLVLAPLTIIIAAELPR